jgi:hypothetical protein
MDSLRPYKLHELLTLNRSCRSCWLRHSFCDPGRDQRCVSQMKHASKIRPDLYTTRNKPVCHRLVRFSSSNHDFRVLRPWERRMF